MRIIELDAKDWKDVLDFYRALLPALGAPEWHGTSIDALLDTMVWSDEINEVKPPYTVRIKNTAALSKEISDKIYLISGEILEARAEFNKRHGHDVDVNIEVIP